MTTETLPVLWHDRVILSPDDLQMAGEIAVRRQRDNERRQRPDAYGARGGVTLHKQGAEAELAFLRAAGYSLTDWASYIETDDLSSLAGDVAGWQIRSTQAGRGHLLIHPRDPADSRFALLINRSPHFRVAGWILARDARQRAWWRQLSPRQAFAFCVPQPALHPFVVIDEDSPARQQPRPTATTRKAAVHPLHHPYLGLLPLLAVVPALAAAWIAVWLTERKPPE